MSDRGLWQGGSARGPVARSVAGTGVGEWQAYGERGREERKGGRGEERGGYLSAVLRQVFIGEGKGAEERKGKERNGGRLWQGVQGKGSGARGCMREGVGECMRDRAGVSVLSMWEGMCGVCGNSGCMWE